ncbi:glycosyltransferase family 2 protein [Herbiconiux sp.]|uniref:glycosyltransferase n=1 Tax=Herbiconiux sp. TaxID=1871186 RepID=UPI0025BDC3D6|nr:glycosyltransferase family 2 protein [Herbiconiux sp.]
MIGALDVVLPARDEEQRIGSAIEAVLASRDRLSEREPGLPCRLVVVLDACTDRSRDIARSFGAQVELLEVSFAAVGAARAAGVEHLLRTAADVAPRRHWIGNTDADTRVPASWLLDQLQAARSGALLALGRVVPHPAELAPHALDAWDRAHPLGERHVFGANLGVRADVYRRAGGFPPATVGEDVALVAAVQAIVDERGPLAGQAGSIVDLRGAPAVTSARVEGRAPGGFADYLASLAE